MPLSARAHEDGTIVYSINSEKFQRFVEQSPEMSITVDSIGGVSSLSIQLRRLPFLQGIDEPKLWQLGMMFEFKKVGWVMQRGCSR